MSAYTPLTHTLHISSATHALHIYSDFVRVKFVYPSPSWWGSGCGVGGPGGISGHNEVTYSQYNWPRDPLNTLPAVIYALIFLHQISTLWDLEQRAMLRNSLPRLKIPTSDTNVVYNSYSVPRHSPLVLTLGPRASHHTVSTGLASARCLIIHR